MSVNDITLSGAMRQDLASLQLLSALQERTTNRLATGKKVNSSVDDPSAYFAAQNNMNRVTDLAARKDAMGEAVQTVTAATQGIDAISNLIQQAKGLAASALGSSAADRATLSQQFDALRGQIDDLANDAKYKGTNLLKSGSLVVNFNEDASSKITISGFDATTTGLNISAAQNSWVADTDITAATTQLDSALSTLRTKAQTLSSNLGVVNARQDFTTNMINTLTVGANNLTAADQNEEGANMLALQTRQQLGVVALSLSNQAQQSILRLF